MLSITSTQRVLHPIPMGRVKFPDNALAKHDRLVSGEPDALE